jgi:hypothetical protein
MGKNAPFQPWGTRSATVMKSVPNGARQHIVVHWKFSTYSAVGSVVPELLHTVFEATVIEKTGLALPNYSRVFFEGQAIVCHIGAIGKTKNRNVFSTMEDMNFGEDSQI